MEYSHVTVACPYNIGVPYRMDKHQHGPKYKLFFIRDDAHRHHRLAATHPPAVAESEIVAEGDTAVAESETVAAVGIAAATGSFAAVGETVAVACTSGAVT